eukprot:GFUD01009837.1.p1 GENE.GFUD01009837.1~~GFUD01009837.1.p1  ORF type:complete len:404 (+),score=49.92 GFUD01009837.1:222-1433(+)
MEADIEVCDGFAPNPCISYTNCTGSAFIAGWTDVCCQPMAVKNTRYAMLSVIGLVGIVGTVCNIITISTFIYLYFFAERIKKKFGHEFVMVKDPVFFLILHLSFCDLLYCIFGLPSYWIVHYHGYFPYSEEMCKYSAFTRNVLAYADFNTLALISAYFAWRRSCDRSYKIENGGRPALAAIICVWIFCISLTCVPFFGFCGHFGYDSVQGRCHIICCQGHIIEAVGVGLPSLVVVVSYSLLYINLTKLQNMEKQEIVLSGTDPHGFGSGTRTAFSCCCCFIQLGCYYKPCQATEDGETGRQRKAVMILTICYVVFILPHSIFELLPSTISDRALISVLVHAWFWVMYIVNFFIYIIFWRRVRKGIQLLFMDLLGMTGWKCKNIFGSENVEDSDPWWLQMQEVE